jgi:hypothetical protein
MFRRSRATTFFSHGQRRSRWRLPRWLWLLLLGSAIGVGAVVAVQQKVLPPRLTAQASSQLSTAFDVAEAERLRLAQALTLTTAQLTEAVDARKVLTQELTASRSAADRQRGDLAAVVDALPPDPRAGVVAVRALRLASSAAGELAYDVVLTREKATARPLAAVMQVVVTGDSSRRGETSVTLPPVTLALGLHAVLRGTLPLPEGFRPRQASVRILSGQTGPLLGMRVGLVK